ncbi:MAG: Ig-like domain-containing protein [Cyclobacteriaceae bacterium]
MSFSIKINNTLHRSAILWMIRLGALISMLLVLTFEASASGAPAAPVVNSSLPTTGSTISDVTPTLRLEFDQNISFGTGEIMLYDSQGDLVQTFSTERPVGISITNNYLFITPTKRLLNDERYYVVIEATTIWNGSSYFAGYSDPRQWYFFTEDQPLAMVSSLPANGATDVDPDHSVSLTFNKRIEFFNSYFYLKDYDTDQTRSTVFYNETTRFNIDGPTITLDFWSLGLQGGTGYITADNGSIKTVGENEYWSGISDNSTIKYDIRDERATISSVYPNASTTGLAPANGTLSITFSEDIDFSDVNPAQKTFELFNSSDERVEYFTGASHVKASIDGNVLSWDLAWPLESNETYYVNFPETMFSTASGNWAVGIDDNTTWTFTTRANDGDGPGIVSRYPTLSDQEVPRTGLEITMTFDEPMNLGAMSGEFGFYSGDNYSYNIGTNATLSEDRLTVTATYPYTLLANTEYNIRLDEISANGYPVLYDDDGNTFAGYPTGTDWLFKTYGPVEYESYSPASGSSINDFDGVVTLTANHNLIAHATGYFRLMEYGNNHIISVVSAGDPELQINGNEATIDFGPVDPSRHYYIHSYYALKDQFSQFLPSISLNLSDPDDWHFTSADTQNPTLESTDPIDESLDVSRNAVLQANFSEYVRSTGQGTITIYNVGGTVHQQYASDASEISYVLNNAIQIADDNLVKGNSYYVLVSNDAIEDYFDRPFAGISSNDTWNFTLVVNQVATDIAITNQTVDENNSISPAIGTLSNDDPDTDETITYSLVSGDGDTDNASFRIGGTNGNYLYSKIVFDYETKDSYTVRIQSDDGNGGVIEEAFVITINNVIETGNDILSFSLAEENASATIDDFNHTIDIETVPATDLTSLIPTVELSSGASITSHNIAEAIDFTNSVDFVVEAENGTEETWTITVTRALNSAAEIISMTFDDQIGDAVIDSDNATVEIQMESLAGLNGYSTNLEGLVTELSFGATIEREDGSIYHYFYEPEVYVVTAEDGTTKNWTITANFEPFAAGTLTVGSGGDFDHLGYAFRRLGFVGMAGDVTLELLGSSHAPSAQLDEHETHNGYTLTIQPAVGVTDIVLTNSTSAYGMSIDFDHLVINGMGELSFKNISSGRLLDIDPSTDDSNATATIDSVTFLGRGVQISSKNSIVENSSFLVGDDPDGSPFIGLITDGANGEIRNNTFEYGSFINSTYGSHQLTAIFSYGGEVVNNFIYLNPTNSGNITGIAFRSENAIDIHHNTIVIEGTAPDDENVNGVYEHYTLDNEVNIHNNLIQLSRNPNTSGERVGLRIYHRINNEVHEPNYAHNNINIPVNAGGITFVQDGTTSYASDNLTDLTNSVDGITFSKPNFTDVANGDLTLTGASLSDAELRGTQLGSVTEDFFGTTRSTSAPSKGAHEVPNNQTDISAFTLAAQTGDATLDPANHTVDLEVAFGTDVTNLSPVIEVSSGASISPASGTSQDFSSSVEYTVTAEDGTEQAWTVTVTVAPPRTGTDILTFEITGYSDEAVINVTNHTVSYRVPFGTSLTSLTPTFTLSGGASSDPASGVAQDFSSPVVYTVTAEDVTVDEDWTVTVLEANVAPTDIALTSTEIDENLPVGSVVGTISGTDPNGDEMVFSLVSGENSAYNYLFYVDQATNELKTNYLFDYEAFDNAGLVPVNIRLEADDQQGETYEEVIAISILDLDEIPPVLTNESPSDNSENIELDTEFTLTYDENLVAGTGSYLLRRGDGQLIETLDVDGSGVDITNNIVTITPSFNLIYDTDYYIEALAGAVEDEFGNDAPAITAGDWSFKTKTLITNLSPADDASEVDLYADLVITFSETVVLQTGGSFEMFKTTNDEQIGVTWSFNGAVLDGNTVTYDIPDGVITPEEDLYVVIRNGIEDQEGNPIDIIGNSTWNFITKKVSQEITFGVLTNKTYGDLAFTLGGSTDAAGLNVEYESSDPTIASISDDEVTIHKTGTVDITASQSGSAIYEAAQDVVRSLTIEKAELAVYVDDEEIEWGEEIPTFNITYGDFENDDDASDLTNAHTASTLAEQGSNSGDYAITISTETDDKYDFVLNHGTLTINNNTPTEITMDDGSIGENNAIDDVVIEFSTTDLDEGQSHSYTLVAGTGDEDNASFYITDNVLYTSTVFDHESDDTYLIRVRTDDQNGGTFDAELSISIADVNEQPTDVNVDGSDEIDFDENTESGTSLGSLASEDQDDGDTFSYELVSGDGSDHNDLFTIESGLLKTNGTFNHEEAEELTIRVKTTDAGGLTYEGNIQIFVNDISEAPTGIELSANDVAENSAIASQIGSFSSVDEDEGETFTYSFVDGENDNDRFNINGDLLEVNDAFSYEEDQDPLEILVETNDGNGGVFEQSFTINITDVAEAPTEIVLDNANVDETSVIGTVVGNLSAQDEDLNESHSYTLVAGGGDTDNASFDIVNGQLITNEIFDYETKNSYAIRLGVTDKDGLTYSNDFAISINDLDPMITSIEITDGSLVENLEIGTTVETFSTIGEDLSGSYTYTLVSGEGDADNTLFSIAGDELQVNGVINFESNSSLSIRVQSDDGAGIVAAFPLVLTVTDDNDEPSDISLSSQSIDENNDVDAVVATLSTTDEDDTDTHSYELATGTGDTHNDKFSITGSELKANESFDYETLNELEIRIRTDDGNGGTFEEEIIITVNDVFEMLDQTVTFDSIADYKYGDRFKLVASATSSLDVTFAVVSGPASIEGDSVIINGVGEIVISADQSGNANYNAADQVQRTFNSSKADQTIDLDSIADYQYGEKFKVSASASSGLGVTYAVVSGSANIVDDTVMITGVGEVTISADQLGDDYYNAASQVTKSFTVDKADQTITFEALSDKAYGDDEFVLSATSSSDLDVSFSIVSGNATVSGDTLTITGAGTVNVAADQSGDDHYNAAEQVSQSFEVAKADQTITFEALSDKTYGDEPFVLSATASSGLNVALSVVSGNGELSGDTLTITGTGDIVIAADQVGDAVYNAADQVSRTFNVSKADQTITFEALSDKIYGDEPFVLSATASSGLDVTFSVVSGNGELNGDTLTITGAGDIVIAADQVGDATYNAADQVTRTLNVSKADQTIALEALSDKTYGDESFVLSATASSGLDVTFSVVSGNGELNGDTLTITGAGDITIAADQSGNDHFSSASQVTQSFVVAKASQTVTIESVDDKLTTDEDFSVSTNASSGLSVTYEISGPANIEGNLVSLNGDEGTVVVIAKQIGNDDYISASDTTSFQVSQPAITIKSQTVSLEDVGAITFGDDPLELNASASSGLSVTLEVLSGPGSLQDNLLTLEGAGTIEISVSQAGNAEYESASDTFVLQVAKADQIVTIEDIDDKQTTDDPFDVIASSTSGLELNYSIAGPANISGNTITLNGIEGEVIVMAIQPGDDNVLADTATVSFMVTAPEATLGVEMSMNISVYPNPATNFIKIGNVQGTAMMSIYTMQGRKLMEKQVSVNEKIDVSSLSSGTYLITTTNDRSTAKQKILIQR